MAREKVGGSWNLFVVSWNIKSTDASNYLKPTVLYAGIPLEGLDFFPTGLQVVGTKNHLFVLNNDPLAIGVYTGSLLYYKLELAPEVPVPPEIVTLSNAFREGICDLPFDFNIVSFDTALILNNTLYVAALDGNGMGLAFFPI